jgi:CheY-like chemotaxis protein/anti-sigma regulatory factor (Ser/Thr protein kinase)
MQLDMGLMTLEDVCQASLQFINQLAGKKQIKVLFTFDEQVRIIEGDERRLKQILVNLLSNAVKFTPEGGQVALEVQGDQAQGLIRFVIRDTGIGIDTKTIPHLFKPFVQADSSLSREHEGTGLGLALVYRLTKLHDGSITVESELGQGSQFTITLPWIAYNFNDQAAKTGLGPLSVEEIHSYLLQQYSEDSPPLVLVVEDNQANLMALVDFLKTLNFRVKVAQNGLEGLELAKAYHPDLILMDIQMPGMDGLEATRRIRAVTELKSVPIIALTALTMPGDRERCLAAGITDYISKPVKLKQLGEIICSHLSGSGADEKQTE